MCQLAQSIYTQIWSFSKQIPAFSVFPGTCLGPFTTAMCKFLARTLWNKCADVCKVTLLQRNVSMLQNMSFKDASSGTTGSAPPSARAELGRGRQICNSGRFLFNWSGQWNHVTGHAYKHRPVSTLWDQRKEGRSSELLLPPFLVKRD